MKKGLSTLSTAATLACILLMAPATGSAGLISYNSRSIFEAAGTIAKNYGYEDIPPTTLPGAPWTTHGITYTSPGNYIVGPGSRPFFEPAVAMPLSNVLMTGWMGALTGNIDTVPQYNMFGVDMAYIGSYSSDIYFRVFTNLAEYTFWPIILPDVGTAQTFYGWTTGSGEYFTGFSFGSQNGNRSAPTMDNTTLGHTGNPTRVPEPAMITLLAISLVGLAAFTRKWWVNPEEPKP
jgi:hypothetical protein